jgi:hypothetical protein
MRFAPRAFAPFALLLMFTTCSAWALDFPGPTPGAARATVGATALCLENNVLRIEWRVADGALRPVSLTDKLAKRSLPLDKSECFQLVLANTPLPGTRTVAASALRLVGQPTAETLTRNQTSLRVGEQQPGRAIVAKLTTADKRLEFTWRAILRDGSNYVRQETACLAKQRELEFVEMVVWDLAAPGAAVCGVVDGSPVVAGNWFFAAEHPLSKSRMADAAAPRFTCSHPATGPLMPGHARWFRALVGVAPAGQLRRAFLYYLERERAQPYRPLLHYNNGPESGNLYWMQKGPEARVAFRRDQQRVWLAAIDTFGRELVQKRGVVIDSFAHDHTWDDENLVWQFNDGYPQGFAPAQQLAAKYGSHVGVWFSPFGGYRGRRIRIEAGRRQGFETDRRGLTLAGPRYFARFLAACLGMVDLYGVNYFKFDGFGASNNQPGALDYASDVEGLLRVIVRLRAKRPDVFINPSTGSWPSPFWLLYADSIWRQGHDINMQGKGSDRQRWTTYRDGQILAGVVKRGPLYPVNSLMIHGIYVNRYPLFGNPNDPRTPRPTYHPAEIVDEIRSFFATGINLQEMYVNPELMTPLLWDTLAEGARWARANAHVLVDTHAIGGDALAGEVYGWASWTPRKAIFSLRNPDDQPATLAVDVGQAFELPANAPTKYSLKSPWKADAGKPAVVLTAGQKHTFQLRPFETLVFEATPIR